MKTLFIFLLLPLTAIGQQTALTSPDDLFGKIHWKYQTPVKNQGMRNTCSAFGIAAALETFDGAPKDLSEKYLYGAQKAYDYVKGEPTENGQFLKKYVERLQTDGAIMEEDLPYNPEATKTWHPSDTELVKYLYEGDLGFVEMIMKYRGKAKIFLNQAEYLDGASSQNVEYLKLLLSGSVRAIPVSYNLYAPAWAAYPSVNFTSITPDLGYNIQAPDGKMYQYSVLKNSVPDLADRIAKGEYTVLKSDANKNQYNGHVVTIIGYDSEGFIIKNSWGSQWRKQGYERVSFDFHKLFAYEALIMKSVRLVK